jgi:hypothetical protein
MPRQRTEYDKLERQLNVAGPANFGPEDLNELHFIAKLKTDISEILAWVANVLMPCGQALETAEGLDKLATILEERAQNGVHHSPHV